MGHHACSVVAVPTKRDWGLVLVYTVPLIPCLQLPVLQTPLVSATQGTRGQTEPHACSAVSINTKKVWGLVLVYTVVLIQNLELVVSQTPLVSATQGTRERMVPHACSAALALSKNRTHAAIVQLDLSLWQEATTLRPVCAMLVGWAKTVTVQHVWLANIRPALGLLRARTVSPGNFQMPSTHPQTRATNVQLAFTRQTTDHGVSRVQQIRTPRHGVTPLCPAYATLVGRA